MAVKDLEEAEKVMAEKAMVEKATVERAEKVMVDVK